MPQTEGREAQTEANENRQVTNTVLEKGVQKSRVVDGGR